ncbi:CARDB domain-containing protein [Chloroflexota bacterium]
MTNEETLSWHLVVQPTGEAIPLTKEPLTIGAGDDNVFVLDDPQAAAHHAAITWRSEEERFVLEDLGSEMGTFVNEQAVSRSQALSDGDVIRIAGTLLEVRPEPLPTAAEDAELLVALEEQVPPTPPLPPSMQDDEVSGEVSRSPILTAIIVGLMAVATVACCLLISSLLFRTGGGRPYAAIESPADRSQIGVGNEIILRAVAGGTDNITSLELGVDGVMVASASSLAPEGEPALTVSSEWMFNTPGEHEISALAYTSDGEASRPASVIVVAVEASVAPPEGTPTLTPVPGRPTSTPAPAPEPSSTVPPPPAIEYFQVSPASVTAGGCATLQWGSVLHATDARIEPDVGGVGTPGSIEICPAETTTYVLVATGPGGETPASTTITVVGGLPDLTIDSMDLVPLPVVQGQDSEIRLAIRNQGVGPAGAFNWEWDAGPEGVHEGRVYGLDAGETEVVSAMWKPSDAYGSLSTVARVDTGDEVPEGDESNNELQAAVEVLKAPSTPETVTLRSEAALDGYRVNDGTGSTKEDIVVGNGELAEGDSELIARGFLSFDITSIPEGAAIDVVELRFYQTDIEGDPYSKLGSLVLEHIVYGDSLDAGAFDVPSSAAALLGAETSPGTWYVLSGSTIADWLKGDLSAGLARFQLRLRFDQETDGDGLEDWIGVTPGGGVLGSANAPQLSITYTP